MLKHGMAVHHSCCLLDNVGQTCQLLTVVGVLAEVQKLSMQITSLSNGS